MEKGEDCTLESRQWSGWKMNFTQLQSQLQLLDSRMIIMVDGLALTLKNMMY